MNGFNAAQARHDYSAHFGPADSDDWWHDAAIQEYWDECAADYAAFNVDYILDREDMAELVQRVARLSRVRVTDETMRGLGQELLEIARAYQVINENAINAMCIKRGEEDRRDRRDW